MALDEYNYELPMKNIYKICSIVLLNSAQEVDKRVPCYINLVAMTLQKQEYKCLVLE